MEIARQKENFGVRTAGIYSPEKAPLRDGAIFESEKIVNDISLLKAHLELKARRLASIKKMIEEFKNDGVDTGSLENAIISGEEELFGSISKINSYGLGEAELGEGEILDLKEFIPEFARETKENTPHDEGVEKEMKKNELEGYEIVIGKVKEEFLKLKMVLDHEKSEWESDYESIEMKEQVDEIKAKIRKDLKGDKFAFFTKNDRRKKANESLEELLAIDENFRSSNKAIFDKWLQFRDKTISSSEIGNSDLNLAAIRKNLLFDKEKDPEILQQMSKVFKEVEVLVEEIENCRQRYEFGYDGNNVITKEEREEFEKGILDLSL